MNKSTGDYPTISTTDPNTTDNSTGRWYQYTYSAHYTIPYFFVGGYESGVVESPDKLPEGVNVKGLYEVIVCYGEDRKEPFVKVLPPVIADSDEDARIKSGAYGFIKPDWDADFLTIIPRKLGDVKIKSRPQEVKQV